MIKTIFTGLMCLTTAGYAIGADSLSKQVEQLTKPAPARPLEDATLRLDTAPESTLGHKVAAGETLPPAELQAYDIERFKEAAERGAFADASRYFNAHFDNGNPQYQNILDLLFLKAFLDNNQDLWKYLLHAPELPLRPNIPH